MGELTPQMSQDSKRSLRSARRPRVLLAAGGTGGHIYPAVALSHALAELAPDVEVQFICGNRPSEWQIYRRLGIQPWVLPLGHRRPGLIDRFRFWGQFMAALARSRRQLRQKPVQVAVGFGSYVSVAPLLAARLSGARIVLHEQNERAGSANRALAPLASSIGTAVERPRGLWNRRRQHAVGNPIRSEILAPVDRAEARRYFRVGQERLVCLCLGGSQGAQGLNRLLLDLLHRSESAENHAAAWQLLWSTGPAHFEVVQRELATMRRPPEEHSINPYIEEMARAYAAADLIIARAGALTLSELTALGKPSILLPLPHAGRHQFANALRLDRAGAAHIVDQDDPRALDQLESILDELARDPGRLATMAEAARSLGRPDAAHQLARLVLEFVPDNLRS